MNKSRKREGKRTAIKIAHEKPNKSACLQKLVLMVIVPNTCTTPPNVNSSNDKRQKKIG